MTKNLRTIRQTDSWHIKRFIHEKEKDDVEFGRFMKQISSIGKLFLIGGGIRDIINENKIDDLDVIIKTRNERLIEAIKILQVSHKKNKLGGYKIEFKSITLDIWSIDDNWAFRENILSKKIPNLQKGTFFNFDSLVYNVHSNKIYSKFYNECIRQKRLDIITGDSTVNQDIPESVIVKAFTIKAIYNLEFSDSVKFFIRSFIDKDRDAVRKIITYKTKTYRQEVAQSLKMKDFHEVIKGIPKYEQLLLNL